VGGPARRLADRGRVPRQVTDGDVDLRERESQLRHVIEPIPRSSPADRTADWTRPDQAMATGPEVPHDGRVTRERSVLIVDDNATVCAALGAYLNRVAGWPVVLTAPDAARGLLMAAEHSPAAIVLDNRMPGGDGIDVLDSLRRACPQAVIVVHTSDDSA